MRVFAWADDVRSDVIFAIRQLRAAPAFTLVAVTLLALGIGANSAMFALADAALLRPLPFPASDRLVMLYERTDRTARSAVSPLNLQDWQARTRSFDAMAGFIPGVGGMVMEGRDGLSETVPRQWVGAAYFDVLAVRAIVGRTFTAEDDRQRANVAVLSEGFWRTRFAGDPDVVGRDVRFDGTPYTVVGVVPHTAQLVGRPGMWALIPTTGAPPQARRAYVFRGLGRLRPGVDVSAAARDLEGVAEALAREYPDTNRGRSAAVLPLRDGLLGDDLRRTSMLFLSVVGVVLLACCANLAGLLVTRAAVRRHELGVRVAIGANRGRVVRLLLVESLLLAAIGGLAGCAVGVGLLRVVPAWIPDGLLPEAVQLAFDGRVLGFAVSATVVVGVLFGLAPAWQGSTATASSVLGASSRGATPRAGALRDLLVIGEVAAATSLLIVAGLLLRTLAAVTSVDRGYRTGNVVSLMVDPLGSQYPTAAALLQFFDRIETEALAVPGVAQVAWSSTLPLGTDRGSDVVFDVVGDPPAAPGQLPSGGLEIVSSSYFAAIDLPIVAGRSFDTRDRGDGVPVCIVSEAFVRRHAAGRSPIGLRLALRPANAPQATPLVREIVGVARQVPGRPDETESPLHVYVPLAQQPSDDMFLLARPSSGPAEALVSGLRAAIGRVDTEQLVSVGDVLTLDDVAAEATARHRFRATLVALFAALAVLLAMAGVVGVLTYGVQQRVRELAVRRALGARAPGLVRLVVGRTLAVQAVGLILGVITATTLRQGLANVVFGVETLDVATFAVAAVVCTAATAAAMLGPIRRALRVDPAVELRL